ncbi:MAG: sirohydrochlorin cobaltochelatase [Clostridium butyricum]|nr:sirohydrochlorin cobaltochelatase [Clostridium butyricum]
MKKALVTVLAIAMTLCCLSGCGAKNVQQETASTASKEVQKDSDTAILVVSFGTSYNDSRDITIGAVETAIAEAFPKYEVRRAFTSQIIIDVLKERDGLEIDNVEEALDRAVEDGIKELIVQPTHLMNGFEYNDLAKSLTNYLDKFDKITLADPLLMSDADFDSVIKAITAETASYEDGETAICFMGHGTEAESNAVYGKLQEKLTQTGYENYYIGTVEAEPTLDDLIAALKAKGTYKKVVLQPLMVVAGDHANNDMAGAEEDSWKSALEKEGYEVICVIKGLGQFEAIQNLYVEHIKDAIASGETLKE